MAPPGRNEESHRQAAPGAVAGHLLIFTFDVKKRMRFLHPKSIYDLLKSTASAWTESKAPRLGAALAFYTIFAIAPMFVIALAIAGLWFGEEAARGQLFAQISGLVGTQGGEAIQSVVAAAHKPTAGVWATTVALVTLFLGATGVFVELQDALNSVWGVRQAPGRSVWRWFRERLLSFAMVAGIGFLLLVSLVLSAALSALGGILSRMIPGEDLLWAAVNFVLTLGIITLLFAVIFKVLPDVTIAWGDVWVGAFITALLFNLGKYLFGLYLGRSTVASAYGAAGSLVIVLLWVYYSAQILFFGAQFTRLHADRWGSRVKPAAGARFITMQEVREPAKRAR